MPTSSHCVREGGREEGKEGGTRIRNIEPNRLPLPPSLPPSLPPFLPPHLGDQDVVNTCGRGVQQGSKGKEEGGAEEDGAIAVHLGESADVGGGNEPRGGREGGREGGVDDGRKVGGRYGRVSEWRNLKKQI